MRSPQSLLQGVTKKGKKKLTVGAAIGLVGAALFASAPSSAFAAAQPAFRLSAAETHAVSLRAQLGLDDRPDYVHGLSSQSGLNTTVLGIPITPAEHSELDRRSRLGAKIRTIDSRLHHDTTYAGAWMDQEAGGKLRVAFTRAPSAATTAAVTALLPSGETASVQVVANSVDQLTAIENQVTADIIASVNQTPPIMVSAGINLAANTVEITIDPSAPVGEEGTLQAKYGAALVTVTRGAQSTAAYGRNWVTGRLYGGLMINLVGNGGCTETYTDAKSTYNETYGLTAGHCGPNGTAVYQGASDRSRYVGSVHANGLYGYPSTMCDCAPVGPTPIGGYGTNQVLVNDDNLLTITGSNYTYQGEVACQSGAASYNVLEHLSCGPVMDNTFTARTSADGTSPAFVLYDSVELNAHVQKGDSGGPLIVGSTLVGLVSSAVNSNILVFSRIQHLSDVGLTLSYSA